MSSFPFKFLSNFEPFFFVWENVKCFFNCRPISKRSKIVCFGVQQKVLLSLFGSLVSVLGQKKY